MDGAAAPIDPPVAWAEVTSSPVAVTEAPHDELARAALARCGAREAGLGAAAQEVLSRTLRRLPIPGPDAIAFAQRAAGEPHPWARAWTARASSLASERMLANLDTWLADDRDTKLRRCAVASGETSDGEHALAVVVVDALADLAPLPTRGRTGQWLTVEAVLRVPAEGGSVLVQGPSGSPRPVPAWFDGSVLRARFVLDRPGDFAVQVMVSTGAGPRPVAEASVFADVDPPQWPRGEPVPGGDVFDARGRDGDGLVRMPDDDALARMLDLARAAAGEPPLTRDPRLDAVARAHARTMAAARALAHDAGDGDPAERLGSAGLTVNASGENVAHAASVLRAHTALWASPAHRANMLRRAFDRVGVAVVRDDRGEAWVVETFASGLQ